MVVLFDVLHLNGEDVMREPWRDRQKRLEDIAASATLPGGAIVPTTEDAAALWDLWVIRGGGEGIVLKEPDSRYVPGARSPAWWKVKAKPTLEVAVTGGTGELVPVGRLGRGGLARPGLSPPAHERAHRESPSGACRGAKR